MNSAKMTILPTTEEEASREGTGSKAMEVEDVANPAHEWRRTDRLSDSSENWYAQIKAKYECGYEPWADAKVDEPVGFEISYFNSFDQEQVLPDVMTDAAEAGKTLVNSISIMILRTESRTQTQDKKMENVHSTSIGSHRRQTSEETCFQNKGQEDISNQLRSLVG